MPIYHIVLFKLKPDVPSDKLEALSKAVHAMVGQVPGEYDHSR
jgi:hypothetical protein